jgi:hypothetical protein
MPYSGHDPVDVAARDRDGLARLELREDRGPSGGRPRREADDRFAALGGERAAVEGRAGRDAAVGLAVERLGADLDAESTANACVTETIRGCAAITVGSQTCSIGWNAKRSSLSTRS